MSPSKSESPSKNLIKPVSGGKQMSNIKYFAFAPEGSPQRFDIEPKDANIQVVNMDSDVFKGCIFGNAGWFLKPLKWNGFFKHQSDELLMFIGGDPNDHENLNAEIELWIENDKLVLTKTSIVFVPAGTAHGYLEVKKVKKPLFHYTCHINTDTYEEHPAEATAAKGTYADHWVERYAPVDGKLPEAPEGFLTLLLWIDGKRFSGAPYLEAVWFHTVNDTGPETHIHDFDEFIGFFGTDTEHPEALGAELSFFIGGETITVTKSCLVYIPRGVEHSPILVPKMDRPIIHFSGGNGGDYVRKK
jgi:mannose-6-phosphate isomerase-like protein (cupin superfamily)